MFEPKTEIKISRAILAEWKQSPIKYIAAMWGLTPQPLVCQEQHEHSFNCFGDFERGKHITWQQWQILLGVEKALRGEAPRRISVASGHGCGKDMILSVLIHWFLMTRKDAQIGATAPTADQLFDVLWKEIAVWHKRLPLAIQPLFTWGSSFFKMTESPNTWFARARTARKESPEAMAGLHGKHVLICGDEASGIYDEVYRAGEGALTNKDTLVILISNPTRLEGYFYDTHHSDKNNWQTFQFSSIESPIVEPEFAERIESKFGKDSDEYRFMVLGQFPKGGEMKNGWMPLFKKDDIKECEDTGFWLKNTMHGVDPSGEGKNKTVCVIRDGIKAKIVMTENISTPVGIAEKILTINEHYHVKPLNTIVDSFGVGADISMEIGASTGERIRPLNVGNKSSNERFLNIRAELYWKLKEWLSRGGKLVKNEMWKQLLTIYYKRTMTGKIQIMSKAEMLKRGWESPDAADALSLSMFTDTPTLAVKTRAFRQPYSDEEAAERVSAIF